MHHDLVADQHTIGKSIALHLLPGLLISAVYFPSLRLWHAWGYPSLMALMVAMVVALVPFELGYLLIQGRKQQGRWSLQGIVHYRRPIAVRQYLLWVPALFVLVGVIFTLLKPIDAFLQEHIFAWIPAMESGLQPGTNKGVLIVTYSMVAVFGALVGPVVEELYFRGFVLPRMQYAGKWAPLLHSFLFALYHFWTPWMIVTRTLGMLPLVYAVRRRSLYLSMIVHVMVNLIDVIVGVSFILSLA